MLASLGASFTISSSMIERAGANVVGVVNFYQRLLVSSLQVQDVGPKAPFRKFNRAAS